MQKTLKKPSKIFRKSPNMSPKIDPGGLRRPLKSLPGGLREPNRARSSTGGPFFRQKWLKHCKYHAFWLQKKTWLSWNGKRERRESVQALQARREQKEQQEQREQERENHEEEQGESGKSPPTIETASP